jgi:hypothetical protein
MMRACLRVSNAVAAVSVQMKNAPFFRSEVKGWLITS